MQLKIILVCMLAIFLSVSCQKDEQVESPVSFTIVNAIPESNPLISRFGEDMTQKYFIDAFRLGLTIPYGGALKYSQLGGSIPLKISPVTDTLFYTYNGNVNITSGKIYTLFLSGDTLHADGLLSEDNIPNYSDSSVGIRFVNMSSGGKTISVYFAGDSIHQVTQTGYRQISEFIKCPATSDVGGVYGFEFRDLVSGDILGTYDWNYSLFRNNTIVIAGSTDASAGIPLNIFSIDNY